MASIFNYKFENVTRVGDDVVTLSERNRQNTYYGSYPLVNYFKNGCTLEQPMSLATSQPDMYVMGGKNQVGINGCAVDADSSLKISSEQTNPKGRISLYQRQFLTVPYLGKGPVRVEDESRLLQGEQISNKKTDHLASEVSYTEHHHYPLIDSIRKTVTNPENLVEGAAADGWVRGGLSSRELMREEEQ
jgi:hypothetical protein